MSSLLAVTGFGLNCFPLGLDGLISLPRDVETLHGNFCRCVSTRTPSCGDSPLLAVTHRFDSRVFVVDPFAMKVISDADFDNDPRFSSSCFGLSAVGDDGRVLVGTDTSTLVLHDFENSQSHFFKDPPRHIRDIVWSPKYPLRGFVSGFAPSSVHDYDLTRGEVCGRYSVEGRTWGFGVDERRDLGFSVGSDKQVRMWSLRCRGQDSPLMRVGLSSEGKSVLVMPENHVLLCGLSDGRIEVWDLRNLGFCLATFGFPGAGYVASMCRVGASRVVSVSTEGKVELWDSSCRFASLHSDSKAPVSVVPGEPFGCAVVGDSEWDLAWHRVLLGDDLFASERLVYATVRLCGFGSRLRLKTLDFEIQVFWFLS